MTRSASSALLTTGSLDTYISKAKKFELLTSTEENTLANDWIANKNQFSANKIVLSHLRFVVYIANMFEGYNLPLSDLIQEGNIGLLKAINKYNPSYVNDTGQAARFATFSVFYIRAEIKDFVIKNSKIVKMATTKAQRKLFFNLKRHKPDSRHFNLTEVNELAKMLKVKVSDVLEMENRIYNYDCSFDLPIGDMDSPISPSEFLVSEGGDISLTYENEKYTSEMKDLLHRNLKGLDERQRDIIYSRWFSNNKSSLADLADQYQISVQRVSQLESNILKKLKSNLG